MKLTPIEAQTAIWQKNAAHLFSWSRDNAATAPTFTSGTYTNVNDTAGNTIAAGTAIYAQTTSQQYVQVAQLTTLLRLLHNQLGAHQNDAYSHGRSLHILHTKYEMDIQSRI